MLEWQEEAARRAGLYAIRHSRTLNSEQRFGWGYDGIVIGTTAGSAIKALGFERLYQRERDVYLRLSQHGVEEIIGFAVPQLLGFDDEFW